MSVFADEAAYRKKIQETLARIENALDAVDPDVIECEQQFGAMTLRLADGSRCILSAQPSVQQLWLALAAKGVAFHFNFDAASGEWKDDKGQGLELKSYLQTFLNEATGLSLKFRRAGFRGFRIRISIGLGIEIGIEIGTSRRRRPMIRRPILGRFGNRWMINHLDDYPVRVGQIK